MPTRPIPPTTVESAPKAGAGTLAPGSMLGKYRIEALIGTGGMATLYGGRDTMLDRAVAIKQIASNYAADPRWCERFRREAQVLARLSDARNVVRIYELLEQPEGMFLILEYVEGKSLEALLAEGSVGVQAALEILWQTALGLRAVHAAGIIHRDIKPANILVPPDRRAKIADFGVAAHRGGKTSMAMGTTRYMAPELFSGGDVDGRCDIYSLGFIGFEMLAGRHRFKELFTDVMKDHRSESLRWMNWHTRMDVKLPLVTELNPEVPPLVAELIAKMTAKPLGERYASIEDVIEDIKVKFAVPRGTLEQLASREPLPTWGVASESSGEHAHETGDPAGTAIHGAASASARDAAASVDGGLAWPGLTSSTTSTGAPVKRGSGTSLDAAPDDAPTAALPKGPSLFTQYRRPLKYGAIALGVVLVALIGTAIYSSLRVRGITKTAGAHYNAGLAAFNDARSGADKERAFAVAVQEWQAAVNDDPHQRTKPGQMAYRYLPLAQAWAAIVDKNWTAADLGLKDAKDRGADEAKVAAAGDALGQRRWLHTAMQQIDRALAERKYAEAERVLADIQARAAQIPVDVPALAKRIAGARAASQYESNVESGREMLTAKRYDDARKAFLEAQKAVPPGDDARARQIEALLAEVESTRNYDEAVRAGDNAMQLEDFATAVTEYEKARKLRPSAALDQKHRRARAMALIKQATTLRIEGDVDAACDKYREALKVEPDNALAQSEVRKCDRNEEFKAKVKEADSEFDQKQYAAALATYKAALEINKTGHVEERVRRCQWEVLIGQGDALRDRRDWTGAEAKYREAEPFGTKADVDLKLHALSAAKDYAAALDEGDKFLADREFRRAKTSYERARKLKPGQEIETRLSDLDYAIYMDQGERSFDAKDYATAAMWYRKAKKVKETDDVNKRLAESERRAASP